MEEVYFSFKRSPCLYSQDGLKGGKSEFREITRMDIAVKDDVAWTRMELLEINVKDALRGVNQQASLRRKALWLVHLDGWYFQSLRQTSLEEVHDF